MSITKALLTLVERLKCMQGKHVPLHKAHCKHEISDLGRWPAFKCRYWFQQFGFGQFSWTSWWVFKNTSVSSSLPKSTSYSLIPPGWGGRNDSLQLRELSHVCISSYSSPTVISRNSSNKEDLMMSQRTLTHHKLQASDVYGVWGGQSIRHKRFS